MNIFPDYPYKKMLMVADAMYGVCEKKIICALQRRNALRLYRKTDNAKWIFQTQFSLCVNAMHCVCVNDRIDGRDAMHGVCVNDRIDGKDAMHCVCVNDRIDGRDAMHCVCVNDRIDGRDAMHCVSTVAVVVGETPQTIL